MGIMLSNLRIKEFRSIEEMELKLGMTNVVFAQNNSGKSNLLKAINIALSPNPTVDESDIYLSENEELSSTKEAIIDIKIIPINGKESTKEFSNTWVSYFTDSWITTDEINGSYVGIRTVIKYDDRKGIYTAKKYSIMDWADNITNTILKKKTPQRFTTDMIDFINTMYMDAQRDVVEDLKNKKSFFGRSTSEVNIKPEKIKEIEENLSKINHDLIEGIPSLKMATERLSEIKETISLNEGKLEIEPLARSIKDLHKGMDILFQDGKSIKLPISLHGMGTRSWISFLTLGAYVDWIEKKYKDDDEEFESYMMLTMEEPESHLHPQAQKKLYNQILNFNGQKLITTHSESIVAQSKIENLIHLRKENGKTISSQFIKENFTIDEVNRIEREVINSKGELLFSSAVILAEGITEELAIPIFFKEYFGEEPIFSGINILGIGGQNYKTFLNLLKNFNIPWFIFSDGEKQTIKTLKKAIKTITDKSIDDLTNIVILENEEYYEKYLINAGYDEIIIKAINKYHDEENSDYHQECEEDIPKEAEEEKLSYFDNYRKKLTIRKKRIKTDKPPCITCKQDIYEDEEIDYSGDEGRLLALEHLCISKNNKTKYASCIASEIVKHDEEDKRIPLKIEKLFEEISKRINIKKKGDKDD